VRGWPKKLAQNLWTLCRQHRLLRDPGHNYYGLWRELAPRSADGRVEQAHLRAVMDEHIARLEEMVAEYEAIAERAAAERADRAAFDRSPGFESYGSRSPDVAKLAPVQPWGPS